METKLIKLFQDYIKDWSWKDWQTADKDEIVVNTIVDLGPYIDIDSAYDIFYDWSAGLTRADFTGKLVEDSVTFYNSQAFWREAKNNIIADNSFHYAYDEELEELGLMDLFDPDNDGLLINKGVYGRIKAAADENPDSWAVKALLKLWVLQFKENAKTRSQIKREEEAVSEKRIAAKTAKYADEAKAKLKIAKKNYEVLDANFAEIRDIINNTITEYANNKKVLLKADLEKAIELTDEVIAATNGIISADGDEETRLASLDKEDLIVAAITLVEPSLHFDARIKVFVENFFGKCPEHLSSSVSITIEDFEAHTIDSKVITLLDLIWEAESPRLTKLNSVQKQYNGIMSKVNRAKAAQAAANADKPVDPEFISDILAEFAGVQQRVSSRSSMYLNSQDGSYELAGHLAKSEAAQSIALSLVNCNWRALIDDTEVASWRTSDSLADLLDAISDVFDAFIDDLTIEIVK